MTEQLQTDDAKEEERYGFSANTEPEKGKRGGLKKGLKIASAVVTFVCAAVALVSIVLLFFGVIDGFDGSNGYTDEQSAAIVGLAILGIVFSIVMVIVSISCVGAGLLVITNASDDRVKHICASAMGVFDVLAITMICVCGASASVINGRWFYAFIAPFAVDIIMRVVCTVLCIVFKEKENG